MSKRAMQVIKLFSPSQLAMTESTVLEGDVRLALGRLPDESIQCVVTSPPYWGLRDYGISGQIGLEPTLAGFIQSLTNVFEEVRRVLTKDGIFWLNIGDGYTSGNRGWRARDKKNPNRAMNVRPNNPPGLKDKDLLGIPWRLALAMQDNGWYLRSDIVWHKPNVMPESVKDRPTRAHEYLFMFTKSERYRYNHEAVKEPAENGRKRNRRTVWNINTLNSGSTHIASFPQALVEPCLLASTQVDDFVLDPFFGSGTVGIVAKRLGRRFIGIELNPYYVSEAVAALEHPQAKYRSNGSSGAQSEYENQPTFLESPGKYGNGVGSFSAAISPTGTDSDDQGTRTRKAKRGTRRSSARR